MCLRTYQDQFNSASLLGQKKHEIGEIWVSNHTLHLRQLAKTCSWVTSVLKCKLFMFMITLRQFFVGSHESFSGLKKRVSEHPQLDIQALTFLVAWVPVLYPFFSFLATCLSSLILPVPVLCLLMFLTDQLYLLFLVWKPPPVWASFLFWRWKLDLPEYLEMAWEWQFFFPLAGVPLDYDLTRIRNRIKKECFVQLNEAYLPYFFYIG